MVAAIICEYNPIHNGHIYQIEQIKKELKPDAIIAIMSGDYVQRGEPSIFSKEVRTKMALDAGVDILFLLPVCYATSGAELFAYGAVSLLNRLGVVDYLCFGSECGDLEVLNEISDKIMSVSSNDYQIQQYLKEGMTFAKARALMFPEYVSILENPNNILAIEYINALKTLSSIIKPYTIKRIGCPHDSDITNSTFSSASAIRSCIFNKETQKIIQSINYDVESLSKNNPPVCLDFFSDELFYKLSSEKDNLHEYYEMTTDLENRIKNNLNSYKCPTQFIEVLKTKNYTYSRISRALLHVLLNIKGNSDYYKNLLPKITHIRILGLNKKASYILKKIEQHNDLKATFKVTAITDELNKETASMLETEIFVSSLFDSKINVNIPEYSKKQIIV